MGRRKIEMKMVKDSNARQVTFSKRRSGLFKKANELATLCAAEVAIVVFSPGGKPFSFGHPSVDSVTQRFLNQDTSDPTPGVPHTHVEALQQDSGYNVEKLNQQLTELLKQLQIEKKRGQMLDRALKASGISKEQRKPISELGLDELLKIKTSLEELRENLKGRVSEMEASSSLLLLKKASDEEADDDD